jgi:hypothetical protein
MDYRRRRTNTTATMITTMMMIPVRPPGILLTSSHFYGDIQRCDEGLVVCMVTLDD